MKENITDNEKKEIEEMAEDIKKARKCYNLSCCDCEGFLYCEVDANGEKCDTQKNSEEIAKALREFGYRKQSDVIKEFAGEATKAINYEWDNYIAKDKPDTYWRGKRNGLLTARNTINELAEQYGKEE